MNIPIIIRLMTLTTLVCTSRVIASVPWRGDWQDPEGNDSGLIGFIIIWLCIFIISLPVYIIRGYREGQTIGESIMDALMFGFCGTWTIIGISVLLLFIIGIPYVIVNMICYGITGRSDNWPLIIPILITFYIVVILRWRITDRKEEKNREEKNKAL